MAEIGGVSVLNFFQSRKERKQFEGLTSSEVNEFCQNALMFLDDLLANLTADDRQHIRKLVNEVLASDPKIFNKEPYFTFWSGVHMIAAANDIKNKLSIIDDAKFRFAGFVVALSGLSKRFALAEDPLAKFIQVLSETEEHLNQEPFKQNGYEKREEQYGDAFPILVIGANLRVQEPAAEPFSPGSINADKIFYRATDNENGLEGFYLKDIEWVSISRPVEDNFDDVSPLEVTLSIGGAGVLYAYISERGCRYIKEQGIKVTRGGEIEDKAAREMWSELRNVNPAFDESTRLLLSDGFHTSG